MSTVLDPVKQDVTNPTRMVHIAFDGALVALCGSQIKGNRVPESEPVDCHVCAEMDAELTRQGL